MRLDQSSVDIATLVDKIQRGEIDLQPGFQRGQVWPEAKQKRLIDTILRGWYVPAVHIVVNDDLDREEVLDGQQRLRAILDFMNGKFPVDGSLEPDDGSIRSLSGLRYPDLPDQIRSRFRRFTINTVRLREYKPEEPGELFFRLNQLTALTAAEQRNALVGEPRNQIRRLSEELGIHLDGKSIGFSNARMNFDDTLSRLAIALELGGISDKITSGILERRYRDGRRFSVDVVDTIENSIFTLSNIIRDEKFFARLNRSSLFSWLFLFCEYPELTQESNSEFSHEFLISFEGARNANSILYLMLDDSEPPTYHRLIQMKPTTACLGIFNDRSSSRVNDVSSVLLRDLCLNVCLYSTVPTDVLTSRNARLRRSAIASIQDRLEHLPSEPSERASTEAALAKQWEARRAAS